MTWHGLILSGMAWFDIVRYGMIWHGLILSEWYDMAWFDIVRYMVWYMV